VGTQKHKACVGHVFLIDDDDGLRESVSGVLARAGYQTHCWESATDFLRVLPDLSPAVVVVDMRMPDMSGVDMHAALIKKGFTSPIVYISGESTVWQSVQAMKQGAMEFLIKPFGRRELLKSVAAAIDADRKKIEGRKARERFEKELSKLSPRQVEAYNLLVKGLGNRELSIALSVSLPTAKQYKSEVMRKLGCRSLSELLAKGGLSEVR
jgi:FixJ family two-component response regulator